jgi:hypothetical protein
MHEYLTQGITPLIFFGGYAIRKTRRSMVFRVYKENKNYNDMANTH